MEDGVAFIAKLFALAFCASVAVVVRELLMWRVSFFVRDNSAKQTRAPPRYQCTVRIMALRRNFERMRIAVRVSQERRKRRDQPEADEVWRDPPSAPCSKGMQSASSPSPPASILRSAFSRGRSSPAGRTSSGEKVRFQREIAKVRYYDCEAIPSHDTQLRLAAALSSAQGDVYAPTSSPASRSSSQRLGPSCSPTGACDLEWECLDEIVQSDGRVTSEAERLREVQHWLNKVQRFVATKIPDASTETKAETFRGERLAGEGQVSSPSSASLLCMEQGITALAYSVQDGAGEGVSCVAGPGRTVQLRLVTRVHNDTAPALVLELICGHSGEQLFSSRVADLIYCDPCFETRQVAFRTATPGSSWWTLEFSRSVPKPCFWSLVLADLRHSMEDRRGRLATVRAAST